MRIIRTPQKMQHEMLKVRQHGRPVGLVPTMGALHEGHRSLIDRARQENDVTVVSIFVNPSQFGPNEDFLRYPRPFDADKKLCAAAGVDYIFSPESQDMYSDHYQTSVEVDKISGIMCGKFRPGHFKGVATVVMKLFNVVQPTRAYFGMKDYQQLKVVQRMVADLNMPVTVVPCPTVREKTGLARSSRNQYLSPQEFHESLRIFHALLCAHDEILTRKPTNPADVIKSIMAHILTIPHCRIEYVVMCDPETLEPVERITLPLLIATAVWVGKTRLIDNIIVGS